MPRRKKKNKSLKKIIIISLVIILIVGGFFGFKHYKDNYAYTFKLDKTSLKANLNEEVNPKKYINKIKNATVKYNSIDTSSIGSKKIKYVVTDKFKKKHNFYLTVKVIDNIAPKIEGKTNVTIYIDDKIDLNKYVTVTDNYDKDVDLKTEGKVDNKKEGEYKVKYIASDKSGNKSELEITFTVKKKSIYEPVTISDEVIGKSSKGYTIETKNGATYVDNILIANKTYRLSSSYGSGLTNTTNNAFSEMKAAAALEGYELRIGSGFRSFNSQSTIYKNYVKRDGQTKADTYSARPGHSEHQTGLAIDICASGYSCITSNFNGTPPANWLSDNAYKYGFILRYPNGKTSETGYKYESWHFRYVGKELAEKLYNNGDWITLEDYLGITSSYNY